MDRSFATLTFACHFLHIQFSLRFASNTLTFYTLDYQIHPCVHKITIIYVHHMSRPFNSPYLTTSHNNLCLLVSYHHTTHLSYHSLSLFQSLHIFHFKKFSIMSIMINECIQYSHHTPQVYPVIFTCTQILIRLILVWRDQLESTLLNLNMISDYKNINIIIELCLLTRSARECDGHWRIRYSKIVLRADAVETILLRVESRQFKWRVRNVRFQRHPAFTATTQVLAFNYVTVRKINILGYITN